MAIDFDKALGIHEHALELRAKRAEVIANNMANADTPGYKAKDLDFGRALQNALSNQSMTMRTTHEKHYRSTSSDMGPGSVLFQLPDQPDTGDGNSVDSQKEMAKFAQNALEYQTTLMFLNNKFRGLSKALKGE